MAQAFWLVLISSIEQGFILLLLLQMAC